MIKEICLICVHHSNLFLFCDNNITSSLFLLKDKRSYNEESCCLFNSETPINSNRFLLIQFHKNVFLQYLKFSLVSNNVTSLNKIYAL